MEDQRREAAEKETAAPRATDAQVLEDTNSVSAQVPTLGLPDVPGSIGKSSLTQLRMSLLKSVDRRGTARKCVQLWVLTVVNRFFGRSFVGS